MENFKHLSETELRQKLLILQTQHEALQAKYDALHQSIEADDVAKFPAETPHPVLRVSKEGKILYANASSQPLLACWNTSVGGCLPKEYASWCSMASSPYTVEFELKQLDQTMSASIAPIHQKGYINIYCFNITQRKRAEMQLKASEQLHRIQFNRMPLGYILWSTDFRVFSWNPAAEQIFGFSAQEMMGLHPYGKIVPKESQAIVELIWGRLLQGEESAHSVNECLTKEGKIITCSWINTPIRDEGGKVVAVMSMVEDITERVHNEMGLYQSAEQQAMLFNTLKALSHILKPEEIARIAVEHVEKHEGWQTVSISFLQPDGQHWQDIAASWLPLGQKGSIRPITTGIVGRAYRTREMQYAAQVSKDPDFIQGERTAAVGSKLAIPLKWGDHVFGVFNLEHGQEHAFSPKQISFASSFAEAIALALENAFQHVAAEKEGKEKQEVLMRLEESNQALQTTVSYLNAIMMALNNSMIVSLADRQGKIIRVNEVFCQISGYTEEDLIGQDHRIINSGHHPKSFWQNMWKTVSSGKAWRGDVCNKAKDGSLYWVDTVINPIFNENGIPIEYLSIRYLITDKKANELRLVNERQRFEEIISGTNAGTWEWNIQTDRVICNERWFETLGYGMRNLPEYMDAHTWAAHIHPDDLKHSNMILKKHFAGELPYYACEYRMKHRAGYWVWVHDRGRVASWTPDGKPLMMYGAHHNITDRKAIEEAIRQKNEELLASEEELRQTAQNLTLINEALVASKEELKRNEKRLIAIHNELLREKSHLEEAMQELRDARQKIVQNEKMAAIGVLTAGLAHEINNPMNFISGGIQALNPFMEEIMMLLDVYIRLEDANDPLKKQVLLAELARLKAEMGDLDKFKENALELFRGVKQGVMRVTAVIRNLYHLSRNERPEDRVPTNLNEVIEHALLMLHHKYDGRIKISHTFNESIMAVPSYMGLMNQVLTNIISNAIDAIEGKGYIHIVSFHENGFACISIKDSGIGMSEETKKRIFDPFFTTKEVGKGMGLGLAITYSIIERHQGFIEVNSAEGKGTEFVIKLPMQ